MNDALRDLADSWERLAALPEDGAAPAVLRADGAGQAKAYSDAAGQLRAILNKPVAASVPDLVPEGVMQLGFGPDDLCVVVVTPAGVLGKDMPRSLYLGPNDEVPTETMTPFQKLIVGAMLDHAREQLDAG
jgi:hypothetical protein